MCLWHRLSLQRTPSSALPEEPPGLAEFHVRDLLLCSGLIYCSHDFNDLPLSKSDAKGNECVSLLPFVISQQQTEVRQCFPAGGIQLNTGSLSSPPVLPGTCGGFGTVSLCMGKAARSQAAEEEMEEVGSVPWPARDFPPDRHPDALSSCVSVLCL